MSGVTRLTEAAERLVKLYDEWGKPAEAANWFKEPDALKEPAPPPKAVKP